jgi:hypothetical protein
MPPKGGPCLLPLQAQKEGSTEVYDQMKAALTAALEVKQATLRPEIQLLNRLLAVEDALAWEQARFARCMPCLGRQLAPLLSGRTPGMPMGGAFCLSWCGMQ